MRPKIGITTPNTLFHPAYYFIQFSVWLCGGRPVPLRTLDSIERSDIRGLVLGGGTDVFPQLFEGTPKDKYKYDHERDETEIAWLKKAEKENIPVFAICRGAQMMNVMNKGTLHLDVSLAYENAHYPKNLLRKVFYRKRIDIEAGSLFNELTQSDALRVNSMHTQSIDKIGQNLGVTAREKNGVVQAIERPNHSFYLGVQFHPEFMIWRPTMQALFKGLVKAAKG